MQSLLTWTDLRSVTSNVFRMCGGLRNETTSRPSSSPRQPPQSAPPLPHSVSSLPLPSSAHNRSPLPAPTFPLLSIAIQSSHRHGNTAQPTPQISHPRWFALGRPPSFLFSSPAPAPPITIKPPDVVRLKSRFEKLSASSHQLQPPPRTVTLPPKEEQMVTDKLDLKTEGRLNCHRGTPLPARKKKKKKKKQIREQTWKNLNFDSCLLLKSPLARERREEADRRTPCFAPSPAAALGQTRHQSSSCCHCSRTAP
uniref:Uncharacterized protein n=1 Tax=Salix viminalis TaxID=40686 RepID=A0A6N2MMZ0_SALVM